MMTAEMAVMAAARAQGAGPGTMRPGRPGSGKAVRRQPLAALARVDPRSQGQGRRRFWSRFCKRRLGSWTCRIEKAEAADRP